MGGRTAPSGDPAVLRDEPDAADHHQRPRTRAARLQGAPDGALLPGVSRGRLADDLRGRPGPHPRTDREVVEEGRRHLAEVERVARGHRRCDGAAADAGAAQHRFAQAERSARPRQAGLEPARNDHPDDGRRHPVAHHEHLRPARRLVRITADQRRAGRQRGDRNMGRPVRARHRLRDGAPLDRRRRRRPAGQLGLPRGRHGRRVRGDRQIRPQLRRRDPHQRTGFEDAGAQRPDRRRGAGERRGDPRAVGGHHAASEDRVPRPALAPTSCPRTSSPTSSTARPAAAW